MLAARCMHINTHTQAHMHAHTRPCTQTFTPGTTPAMRGTSGIPATCFEEAELIWLVRRWEPEDDRVQVRWDWAASRPSCSFTLWNATYNRNTATHAHTPALCPRSFCCVLNSKFQILNFTFFSLMGRSDSSATATKKKTTDFSTTQDGTLTLLMTPFVTPIKLD